MNSYLRDLSPYPFARMVKLLGDVEPGMPPILMNIGEPKHPMPEEVGEILRANVALFGKYPPTSGTSELRGAVSDWIFRRYRFKVDPDGEVLPVLGSREAIFSFVQALIDPREEEPLVLCPNPFYQIYQGAVIMAGGRPVYAPCRAPRFAPDWDAVPADLWPRIRLVVACEPGNPTGGLMGPAGWRRLLELRERHGFVIASDECYSEIYFKGRPSYGLFDALRDAGLGPENAIVFNSLSKRSNAPGLRSGFVAGGAELVRDFLSYRTYHGSAMSLPVQKVSEWLWGDERHVERNRELYEEKFKESFRIMDGTYPVELPDASFYYWLRIPGGDDEAFAKELWRSKGVKVLPGSYLGREVDGFNPGRGYVRIALVSTPEECREAFERMVAFAREGRFS